MLSIVFLLAAVLIIYYKQISEGYEDQARFDIMQKVFVCAIMMIWKLADKIIRKLEWPTGRTR